MESRAAGIPDIGVLWYENEGLSFHIDLLIYSIECYRVSVIKKSSYQVLNLLGYNI